MALLSYDVQLQVPLGAPEALERLARELGGAPFEPLDRDSSPRPGAGELVGQVQGSTFVLRRSARPRLTRNLHAIARGRVEDAPEGGARLVLRFRPAMLDSPPWVPLVLLSLGGAAVALLDRQYALLLLVPALWAVPLVLVALARPLLRWEAEQVLSHLRARLR